MKLISLALAVLLGGTAGAAAQVPEVLEPPRTRLEAFAGQTGVVIVRGFSRQGDVRGSFGSTVTVETHEYRNAATGAREHGIGVVVHQSGRSERVHTSYVDFDELPALIQALSYLGRVERAATAQTDFQADYRTRGDLVVSAFSAENRGTRVAVSSGMLEPARAHLTFSDLVELRTLVQKAYAALEELRAGQR
jgi:hypothetical protein